MSSQQFLPDQPPRATLHPTGQAPGVQVPGYKEQGSSSSLHHRDPAPSDGHHGGIVHDVIGTTHGVAPTVADISHNVVHSVVDTSQNLLSGILAYLMSGGSGKRCFCSFPLCFLYEWLLRLETSPRHEPGPSGIIRIGGIALDLEL
ncbi:hypothetical protein BV898_10272 [Hypsibius exemplaris]|uniref:Uncharacterized protein n=1 Tax=Hypsibius exemplaris TaxID=2072580 RepID=A0A1W0WK09_HYPEX|nr:hypothetical protein BV898_10272 [Hypsibius exemplaris]